MTLKYTVISIACLVFLAACDQNEINENISGNLKNHNNQFISSVGGVDLWLSSSQIKPEEPFVINLSLPKNVDIVNAKLEGVSMYMGYIPVNFSLTKDVFTATTLVGICALENMQWKLIINLRTKTGHKEQITYYFTVKNE